MRVASKNAQASPHEDALLMFADLLQRRFLLAEDACPQSRLRIDHRD